MVVNFVGVPGFFRLFTDCALAIGVMEFCQMVGALILEVGYMQVELGA